MLHLRSLTHLIALARRLNFARAAEELGISQSALSRSIQALEAQLGMRLFDRDRAGVALTPQGRVAVARAAVLLAAAEALERHLLQSASAEAGKIRLVSRERRSQSPQARSIKQALRRRIKALANASDRDGDASR